MDEFFIFQYAQLFMEATHGAYTLAETLDMPLYTVMLTVVCGAANKGVELGTEDRIEEMEARMQQARGMIDAKR